MPQLAEDDFKILNALEDLEVKRINFGVYEGWSRVKDIAEKVERPEGIVDAIRRLAARGYVMATEDGQIRSRVAELAREVRYVKQRFKPGDADRRPFVVRALKVHIADRQKPTRNKPFIETQDRLRATLAAVPGAMEIVSAIDRMLQDVWQTKAISLAGFQGRALERILPAWLGQSSDDTFVITADTGSGKTEAAILPILAGALADRRAGVRGTRAVLVYPRIRLAANQAQRLTGYIAALCRQPGLPRLTIGLQNKDVPSDFTNLKGDIANLWRAHGSGRTFPFFDCPTCSGSLVLIPRGGFDDCDALTCEAPGCGWTFGGWVGSKALLAEVAPNLFLPVTESLHQWLQNPRYGRLFGDGAGCAPPRAVLADEIHLYSHVAGAQVGHTLRRLLLRAELNGQPAGKVLALGMSATLGRPGVVWGALTGRQNVEEIHVHPSEYEPNPRAREYFYFVQPEVESRGQDIAGASTTIQTLMCLAHGMRRRTNGEGGYRGIVFFDSIDKMKRLHGQYMDAEAGRRLAGLRTYLYDDDPTTGSARRACCRQPTTCDMFKQGECWFHAATDPDQWTATGKYQPGFPLAVCPVPVFSGTTERVDALIGKSDLVFATSSLEVGYDDPDIMLVYQHYAPVNLASFVQRKGRGGRGADDRPVTGVTLSVYSPRDTYFFRYPERMLDAKNFEVPLNMENHFVVRGQILSLLLDLAARGRVEVDREHRLPRAVFVDAERHVAATFGPEAVRRVGYRSLADLWNAAWAVAPPLAGPDTFRSPRDWGQHLPWVPTKLFGTINLPVLEVSFDNDREQASPPRSEDIILAMSICAPGNITRQYGREMLHWTPPRPGGAPLVADEEYTEDDRYFSIRGVATGDQLLNRLPEEIRESLRGGLDARVFRPERVALRPAGIMRGGGWTPRWGWNARRNQVELLPSGPGTEGQPCLGVKPDSRGALVGFSVVCAEQALAESLRSRTLPEAIAPGIHAFKSRAGAEERTGLTVARVFWGAEVQLKLDDRKVPEVSFVQRFVRPEAGTPLLHGYSIETEGIRLRVRAELLDRAVQHELARGPDDPERRYLGTQFLRYLVESRAGSLGLPIFDARRLAELLVSTTATPGDRTRLKDLFQEWDTEELRSLLTDVFRDRLRRHPHLTERRVDLTCEKLGPARIRTALMGIFRDVEDDGRRADFLRSCILHGLAIRLKQAFVRHGRGDERRVRFHVALPLQMGEEREDVIHVFEDGNYGDGTTRAFADAVDQAFHEWGTGALSGCANALDDEILDKAYGRSEFHAVWRRLDPKQIESVTRIADDLGMGSDHVRSLQRLLLVLTGTEIVGIDTYALHDLHMEIRGVRDSLARSFGRRPTEWELVSTVVRLAGERDAGATVHGALLRSYAALEDAEDEDSLGPEERLADQVHRLSAGLCIDGCQACLHVGSDLMSDSMARASTSRRLLSRVEALISDAGASG